MKRRRDFKNGVLILNLRDLSLNFYDHPAMAFGMQGFRAGDAGVNRPDNYSAKTN
jgi:hypothetical protein